MTLTLQGSQWIKGHQIQWAVDKERKDDDDQLKVNNDKYMLYFY